MNILSNGPPFFLLLKEFGNPWNKIDDPHPFGSLTNSLMHNKVLSYFAGYRVCQIFRLSWNSNKWLSVAIFHTATNICRVLYVYSFYCLFILCFKIKWSLLNKIYEIFIKTKHNSNTLFSINETQCKCLFDQTYCYSYFVNFSTIVLNKTKSFNISSSLCNRLLYKFLISWWQAAHWNHLHDQFFYFPHNAFTEEEKNVTH